MVLQIIGDNNVEGDEVIVSDLVPLSPQDSVANDSTLVITIIDNDQGMYLIIGRGSMGAITPGLWQLRGQLPRIEYML